MPFLMMLPMIIFWISFILVAVFILKNIIKSFKHTKKLQDMQNTALHDKKDDSDQFIICEYCDMPNDKQNKVCSSCGAKLDHKKTTKP